jgi:hypothetical protein
MPSTRTPADDLSDQLIREGYSPQITPFVGGAIVRLFNSKMSGFPQAQGDTIYEALDAARRHRDSMLLEEDGKKYVKR